MGRTRVRIRVRSMMVALVVVAISLSAVTRLLRPYPIMGSLNGRYDVAWSDGSSTSYRSWRDHPSRQVSYLGPLVWVRWQDGSASLHLRDTPRKVRAARPLEMPLAVPRIEKITF